MNIELSPLLMLSVLIVLFSILAAEFKNLAYAIVSLFIVTILAALIFFLTSAPYVGLVQLAVFSGAIMVLLIFVFMLTRGGVAEGE